MRDFLQILMVGIGDGAVYAMLGLGLVVIYRSTGLLNFAQGEMAMFSTFIVWTLWDVGLPTVAGAARRHGRRVPRRSARCTRSRSDRSVTPMRSRWRS